MTVTDDTSARALRDDVAATLTRLAELLDGPGGDVGRARALRSLRAQVVLPREEAPDRDVARAVLRLFSGGMGSFNDLVLQDRAGVLPEMREFDDCRSLLFEQARDLL